MEHKTSSVDISEGSDFRRRLTLDYQIRIYAIACEEMETPISFVRYDVIKKPASRPRKLTAKERKVLDADGIYYGEDFDGYRGNAPERETAALWGARMLSEIGGKIDDHFQRWNIPVLRDELIAVRDQLWEIADMMSAAVDNGWKFPNPSSCLQYGKCEFFELCSTYHTPDPGNPPSGFVYEPREEGV